MDKKLVIFAVLFVHAISKVTANYLEYFNKGEKEAYNEFKFTSEITEDINKVYPPALEKVTKFLNGDPEVNTTIYKLLAGPDPYVSVFKWIYDGVDAFSKEPKDRHYPYQLYDFIIVGAGTAGCVVANRLSEVKEWNILLIEAGGDEEYYMNIPLLTLFLQQTSIDWQYKTKPSNKYCTGSLNNQCVWPTGKVVGGTSVLTDMLFTRGSPHDYDNWERLGNEGWSYAKVLKYFKKLETLHIPKRPDIKQRGYSGPVAVDHPSYRTLPARAWVQASQDKGFRYVDYNSDEQVGVSYLQISSTNGTKDSSNRAYLYPINKRKNLHVVKNSLGTKLLFDVSKTRVIGVSFERRGVTYEVYVRNEVVLSAGALNTPQILMLSGIGPRDHLEELGIPVIQDLPVGYNLMDHIYVPITFKVNPHSTQFDTKTFLAKLPSMLHDYVKYHQGPISSTSIEAILYECLTDNSTKAWPDVELLFVGSTFNGLNVFKKIVGFKNDIFNQYFGPLKENPGFTIFPSLLRPKSRGRITLKDRNPRSKPLFDANYLDHEYDINIILQGIKLAISIAEQPALMNIGARLYDFPLKKCLKFGPFGSDVYWNCFIRTFTISMWHFSGTCKMGPYDDVDAVVDPELRVYNMEGLRIIDASVFPVIPVAYTSNPALMTGEKGADLIKEDWGIISSDD